MLFAVGPFPWIAVECCFQLVPRLRDALFRPLWAFGEIEAHHALACRPGLFLGDMGDSGCILKWSLPVISALDYMMTRGLCDAIPLGGYCLSASGLAP